MISRGISRYTTGNHVTFHGTSEITTGGAFENKASYGTIQVITFSLFYLSCTFCHSGELA